MKPYSVLGVKIHDTSYKECLDFIDSSIQKAEKIQICTTNNEFIVEAQKNPKFKKIINQSNISTPDSTGVVWAIKKLFGTKVERITGIDLFLKLCQQAADKKYRIFLLGGSRNTALKAKKNLQRKFPGIHIVGYIDGIPIDPKKQDDVLISRINRARPDIIAVALGAPKQELWIKKNMKMLNAKIFMGLGGSLDYIAGTVPRAPYLLRAAGIEWLFRLIVQPKRIKRITIAVIVFPYMIIAESFKQ